MHIAATEKKLFIDVSLGGEDIQKGEMKILLNDQLPRILTTSLCTTCIYAPAKFTRHDKNYSA